MYFVSKTKFIFFYHSFFMLFLSTLAVEEKNMKRIAIVGAGIGGTSCAHFLTALLGKNKAAIHVYEPNKVGGRLAVVNMDESIFESGGSVIHPRNKYMNEFVHMFDLKRREAKTDKLVGLYDGTHFPFAESKYKFIAALELMWRYGWDLYRINHYLHHLLDNFDEIYTSQNNHKSFETVRDLLASMDSDFPAYLSRSVYDGLEVDANCHAKFINEIVLAANLVNYGQNNDVHQFVGSVSLAGTMDGLWEVDGGNYQVAEKLLTSSSAELHKYAVEKIELSDDKYNVFTKHGAEEFDSVILATPIVQNSKQPIEFVNFLKPISVEGTYHRTISTFVEGVINHMYFGYKKLEEVPGQIFSINSSNFFNSISLLKENVTHSVYKVFSKEPLTTEQLSLLFDASHSVKVKDWLAYPSYSTVERNDSFILNNNLYYINAIEWAASAMEMSIIGAKNVALLIYNNYKKKTTHINKSQEPKKVIRTDL